MAETLKIEKDTRLVQDAGFKVKKKTKGERLPDEKTDDNGPYPLVNSKPGTYWKVQQKDRPAQWWVHAPVKDVHAVQKLSLHAVTEHEDGTVTVSPSIMFYNSANRPIWHGHLRKGVFEELDA